MSQQRYWFSSTEGLAGQKEAHAKGLYGATGFNTAICLNLAEVINYTSVGNNIPPDARPAGQNEGLYNDSDVYLVRHSDGAFETYRVGFEKGQLSPQQAYQLLEMCDQILGYKPIVVGLDTSNRASHNAQRLKELGICNN